MKRGSADTLIDSRPLREGEELRIEISTYRGHQYIGLRRWYRDGDEWKPGKGLSSHISMLPFLRQAVQRAEARALDHDLLDEEAYESIGEPLPERLGGDRAAA